MLDVKYLFFVMLSMFLSFCFIFAAKGWMILQKSFFSSNEAFYSFLKKTLLLMLSMLSLLLLLLLHLLSFLQNAFSEWNLAPFFVERWLRIRMCICIQKLWEMQKLNKSFFHFNIWTSWQTNKFELEVKTFTPWVTFGGWLYCIVSQLNYKQTRSYNELSWTSKFFSL